MNTSGSARDKPFRELGQRMKMLRKVYGKRDTGHDTKSQTGMSKALGYAHQQGHTYGDFEQGIRLIPYKKLLQFCHALELEKNNKKSREELLQLYNTIVLGSSPVDPRSPAHHTTCLVLDKTWDEVGRPACVQAFYHPSMVQSPRERSQDAEYLHWIKTIFACKHDKHDTIIALGFVEAKTSNLNRSPTPLSVEAADILREHLATAGIKRGKQEVLDSQDPRASFASRRNLILIDGPSNNKLTERANKAFLSASWFSGFHFSSTERESGWVIHHRATPGLAIPETDVLEFRERRGFQYRPLDDGDFHDFGVFYAGPTPSSPRHRLILVAGLGLVGTWAAAHAFEDPRIVEHIGRHLSDDRSFCSGLVRYRFSASPQTWLSGSISSVLLTQGRAAEE